MCERKIPVTFTLDNGSIEIKGKMSALMTFPFELEKISNTDKIPAEIELSKRIHIYIHFAASRMAP